jgi:hypothetical protein
MNVPSGFLDVPRRAIGFKYTMARHHGSRMQSLDLMER